MVGLSVPLQALRWGIIAGVALLLLTVFVVTPGTQFPFVVGKALWSRSIIEIVFALWAALALAKPSYRPPRSWLLVALAAGLGVSLLATGFGVSAQRSLWSTYERMQGVVDLAHWFALAVVLASMFRAASEWRALLTFNLAMSLAMACLVIARHYQLDVPFYGALPEPKLPRMSGPFGNPNYLSFYMLISLFVALGFLARSCLPATVVPPPPRGRRRKRRGGRSQAPARQRGRTNSRWPGGVFWAATAALHLWAFNLAGSTGGLLGLFASVGFLALALAFLGRGRARQAAVAVMVAFGALTALLGIRILGAAHDPAAPWLNSPVAQQIAKIDLQQPTVRSRLAAWETGLKGLAERPLLGWGPGNFGVVFGRHATGFGVAMVPHDKAHSQLVEVAATTGTLGMAAYLALWGTTFTVVLRAARRMGRKDRALALFVGAALTGGLVHSQFLFDTSSGWLQTILLLGFVVSLEKTAFAGARHPRPLARLTADWAALLRRKDARVALVAVAAALSATGLAVNQAIHSAAQIRPSTWTALADGIDGFKPLANAYRWYLFDKLTDDWPRLHAVDIARAERLLDWAELESREVVRTEPQNWRIHQSLARMYQAVAATDPEYEAAARHYLERARALAPNRVVFPSDPVAPDLLRMRPLRDGRHELLWRPSLGAGVHEVLELTSDDIWRPLLHVYDPDRASFIPPATRAPGTYHFAVRMCRHVMEDSLSCSPLAKWPPITVTTTETDPGP